MNKIREAKNTLRWLSKFNLGDTYESRIKKTLCVIAGDHSWKKTKNYSAHGKCYFCGETKKKSKIGKKK